MRKSRGTEGTPTAVLSGDIIGQIVATGHNGTDYISNVATINFNAVEDFTTIANGTFMFFNTTAAGAISPTTRMTIGSEGNIYVGGSTADNGKKLSIAGSNAGLAEKNTLRFIDLDSVTQANQVIGKIEFFSSDETAPGAGVKGYISCIAESSTPAGCLVFATDATSGTPTEHMKLNSAGLLMLEGGVRTTKTIYQTAEVTNTPAGTTQTITLNNANHQTLSLASSTGNVTATLTVPSGSSAGTIIVVQHGTTPRDITWAVSAGTLKWMGAEPTWSSDAVSDVRIVSWRYNGSVVYLASTDAGT